ncbi:MAG: DUF99 family protein [Nitrososphaerota archaeon]
MISLTMEQIRFHVFKKGIRVLGIAESFDPSKDKKSTIAGVVMRKDLVIDGVSLETATLGGDDATKSVISLYKSFHRRDINVIMLSGAIISYYNIVDLERVSSTTNRPLICLTYRESPGLEEVFKKRFPGSYQEKIEAYKKLGSRDTFTLSTGKKVYARLVSIAKEDAKKLLDDFVLQGRYPEPVRIASLIASAVRKSSRTVRKV